MIWRTRVRAYTKPGSTNGMVESKISETLRNKQTANPRKLWEPPRDMISYDACTSLKNRSWDTQGAVAPVT